MRKITLILLTLLFCHSAFAQQTVKMGTYWKSASEFIFSFGSVDALGPDASGLGTKPMDVNPVVRFTMFFHFQQQFHYDFNNHVGVFTGVGMRNVGMINELNDTINLKQRVYSLGVPVAIKFGNLPSGFYAALGAEGELFFHYKQKAFYDDEKFKKSEWFSDKVNIFNPSVFLDINSGKNVYMRFKYYLLDFLVEDKQDVKIFGQPYTYVPQKSTLFYVSVGFNFTTKRNYSTKPKNNNSNTALSIF